MNQISYNKCTKCYQNCKTCSEEGNYQQMNGNTYKDNKIKYNNNCFDISDSSIKSFFIPELNNLHLSSCKQDFELYIKEDSNECITLPAEDEGYYISNIETGLSKCHDNCLSCKNGPIRSVSGYIESMECLKCKDSNSSQKTIIKLNNNCLTIIYRNDSTIIFDISEIKQNSVLGTCINFGKILNYEKYECINLTNINLNDNNENTVAIKNSHEVDQNYEANIMTNTNYVRNNTFIINNYGCLLEEFDKDETCIKLKTLIKNDFQSYINLCKVFNGSNFIASVSSFKKIDPKEYIKNGISSFYFGNWTNGLKEYYNIDNEESIIVLNIETKNEENKNDKSNKYFKLWKISNLNIYDY